MRKEDDVTFKSLPTPIYTWLPFLKVTVDDWPVVQ